MTAREHVLLLSCPDRPGIVAAVTATLAAHDANIEDSQQYKDSGTGRFFMRIHFTDPTGEADWHALLEPAAAAYAMEWDVDEIRWYADGRLIHRRRAGRPTPTRLPRQAG